MLMGKVVCSLILFFLLSSPLVTALALGGKALGQIIYKPGETITNHYTIYGSDQPVSVLVDGGVFKYITTSEVVNDEFDLIINFPENEFIPSGFYSLALTVAEDSGSQTGISTQVAVSKTFEVVVYSYEKDIKVYLSVPNINEGSNLNFRLGVQSVGYPDIDEVYGQIEVFDAENKKRGTVVTEKQSLNGLESLAFTPSFDARTFPTGTYRAEAIVWYDGKYKVANTTFLIGNMDLILNNYTAVFQPGFNEFFVQVTSNWGNPLRNVYALLFVNGSELVYTPSINLDPWQQGVLKAIAKVTFPPGEYEALLVLFFEGEKKEIPIRITIVAPEVQEIVEEVQKEIQETRRFSLIPAVITSLILMIILGIYLWRRKKPAGKEQF